MSLRLHGRLLFTTSWETTKVITQQNYGEDTAHS